MAMLRPGLHYALLVTAFFTIGYFTGHLGTRCLSGLVCALLLIMGLCVFEICKELFQSTRPCDAVLSRCERRMRRSSSSSPSTSSSSPSASSSPSLTIAAIAGAIRRKKRDGAPPSPLRQIWSADSYDEEMAVEGKQDVMVAAAAWAYHALRVDAWQRFEQRV